MRSNFCLAMLALPPSLLRTVVWVSTISAAIEAGTSSYRSNCIVNVARPWVIERTSVA